MNAKTKMRLFYALEVAIWVLVITVCVASVRIHQAKKVNLLPTYRLFMDDVDGLIEGSSVRMMGVPIGYVKSISIVQDQVYVKFVLDDKDMKLPQGIIATVEFNGMAGSKSLELYPADDVSKASGRLISIKKTSRLGAALSLFDDMFAKLDSILLRCSHFSEEVEHIMPKPVQTEGESQQVKQDMDYSVNIMNTFIKEFDNNRIKFMDMLKQGPKIKLNESSDEIQEIEEEVSDGQ